MKKVRTYTVMAIAGLMMFSFAGCNIIEKTPESIQDTVYAKVGSTKITKGEVDKTIKQYLDQYKTQYGEAFETNAKVIEELKKLREQQINSLVESEVLFQSAKDMGVTPTDEEIQAKVDERIKYFKDQLQTEEAYNSWLQEQGYDEGSIVALLKKMAVENMVYDKIIEGIEVTDEEVLADYDEKKASTYIRKPGADVTHLLFASEQDASGAPVAGAEPAALARAQEARKKVLAGATLIDLSTSEEYKAYALYEDLGHISFEGVSDAGGSMVQEFTDGFKSLPVNQVSEPIKTSFGYHLIINTKIYTEAEITPLDDKLKETIKTTLLQAKQQTQYTAKVEELKKTAKVKLYEDRL